MSLPRRLSWFMGTLLLTALFLAGSAQSADTKEGFFTTNDGVRLHYIEAGSGKPLVMIPGWSQTAAQFRAQLAGLSDRYRVIAIDMRGHGESDKPDHGYRIQRLSQDVHEFLAANGLTNVTLAGHSMGCSVIWGYWEMYGKERLAKLVLIDQMPMITTNPIWSEQEKIDAGSHPRQGVALLGHQLPGGPGRGQDYGRLHHRHVQQGVSPGRSGLGDQAEPQDAA